MDVLHNNDSNDYNYDIIVCNLEEYKNYMHINQQLSNTNEHFLNQSENEQSENEQPENEQSENEQSENEQYDKQEEDIEYKPIKNRKYVRKTKIAKIKKNRARSSKTIDQKMMRNRESARQCRLRKKEYIQGLEQRIIELVNENNNLKALITIDSNK